MAWNAIPFINIVGKKQLSSSLPLTRWNIPEGNLSSEAGFQVGAIGQIYLVYWHLFHCLFYIDHKLSVSTLVSILPTDSCSFGMVSCLGTVTAAQASQFAYSFKLYTFYSETILLSFFLTEDLLNKNEDGSIVIREDQTCHVSCRVGHLHPSNI